MAPAKKIRPSFALAALLAAALLFAPVAQAAPPSQLWQTPTVGSDAPGFAAGQFATPQGIGVDPNNGHLYVADLTNNRIDELSAWGVFVKAFGWGVRDGKEELETCTMETTCQKGIEGSGAGQIGGPSGVVVDSAGNVYVDETELADGRQEGFNRVQKFSPAGQFLLAFGGDVIADGAAGTGVLNPGSTSITSVTTSEKAFKVGQPIEGTGIEAGTRIAAVGAGTITLSKPAGPGATGTATPISSPAGPNDVPVNEKQTIALAANTTGGTFTLAFSTPDPSPSSATTSAIPAGASAAELQAKLEELANIAPGDIEATGPAGGPWTVEFKGARYGNSDVEALKPNATGLSVGSGERYVSVTSANAAEVCTVAAECQGGASGTTKGQLAAGHAPNSISSYAVGPKIAIGPTGDVFLGDRERIERFEPDGAFKAEVPIPKTSIPDETVQALAMDAAGNFYVSLWGEEGAIKLSPAGSLLHTYAIQHGEFIPAPEALAADAAGDLYAVEEPPGRPWPQEIDARVVEFAPDGAKLIPSKEEEEAQKGKEGALAFAEFPRIGPHSAELPGLATSSACGIEGHDLYVSAHGGEEGEFANLRAFGPPPQDTTPPCEPPPQVPPTISDSYALSAGADSAVVQAVINPHFWADTTYQVHYGTGKCSEGGCEQAAPASPAQLVNRVLDEPVKSAGVNLPGLDPGTTYHYRFSAQSGGGGPVDGPEGTFTTASLPLAPQSECPNQAFRSGPAAALPDCRAYEMVSPIDKNGADIVSLKDVNGATTAFYESAPEGGKLAYSAFRAYGDAQAGPYAVQYLAARRERGEAGEGWSSHSLNPPRGLPIYPDGFTIENEFRAFTPDLCQSWLVHDADPTLAPDAIAGFPNVYRRQDCGPKAGSFEAVTTADPPGVKPAGYSLDLQGVSADGSHTAFQAEAKLTPNANAGTNAQCYESVGEAAPLRLVSVLPNGSASEADCSLGTDNEIGLGSAIHSAEVSHAISADGQKIYWSATPAGGADGGGPGQIYLRKEGKDPTIEVSGTVSKTAAARFLTAAADGSRAIFQIEDKEAPQNGNLYEFNAAKAKATLIAPKAIGLLGASEDASRLYFASEAALGGGAVEGKPNLYFREGTKAPRFVAILSAADANASPAGGRCPFPFCISPLADMPVQHSARVSADGLHAAFTSTASLTGFDNTDAQSGEADAEVYVYDATANGGAGRLLCASCNATGTRPSGHEVRIASQIPTHAWVAAQIPLAANQIYAPRVLSANGSYLFFESYEPLVLRDTNNRQDVYEWERSESEEECEEDGAELYVQANGGCLSLISSGKSSQDSELLDISADGTDAFFTTGSSLVSQDPGLIDVYDARTEGGFPPPPPLREECEGQACQPTLEAPNDPTPASSAFEGAGNVAGEPKPPSCRKPRVRRKGRCVAKKTHRRHRANHKRRNPR